MERLLEAQNRGGTVREKKRELEDGTASNLVPCTSTQLWWRRVRVLLSERTKVIAAKTKSSLPPLTIGTLGPSEGTC